MEAVCEATGMAMTYFTQSSRESENLPLITDFVTFLALRYNLEVKVIRSKLFKTNGDQKHCPNSRLGAVENITSPI